MFVVRCLMFVVCDCSSFALFVVCCLLDVVGLWLRVVCCRLLFVDRYVLCDVGCSLLVVCYLLRGVCFCLLFEV